MTLRRVFLNFGVFMSFSSIFDFALSNKKFIEPVKAYSFEKKQDGCSIFSSSLIKDNESLIVSCRSGDDNFFYRGVENEVINSKVAISGSGNYIFFGPYSRVKGANIRLVGNNCLFYFGAFSTVESMTVMVYGDSSKIIIGDQNMLSARIMFDSSDHHSIYDVTSGLRINNDENIFIDDRVWLGRDVRVNKGAVIASDTVVGQGSIVSGILDSNSIYAGIPAKQIKKGIQWSRMKCESIDEMEGTDRHVAFLNKVESLRDRIASFNNN